jgi:trehalose/maltose hydrolase-like predicted phosphorylase
MDPNRDPGAPADALQRPHHIRPALEETFAAIVIDWDELATDSQLDPAMTLRLLTELCVAGTHVFLVSSGEVGDLTSMLDARPTGAGRLFLCDIQSSAVFEAVSDGPLVLTHQDPATREERRLLNRAVTLACEELRRHEFIVKAVTRHANGRTITFSVPSPSQPSATSDALAVAIAAARQVGLSTDQVFGDDRQVNIGMMSKSDSAVFAARWLATRGITGALILVVGNAFRARGAVTSNSTSPPPINELERAVVVSLCREPAADADGVIGLGNLGQFTSLLEAQIERHHERRVPSIDPDPRWVLALPTARNAERVAEALGSQSNGWVGTRASLEEDGVGSSPLFVVAGVYDERNELLAGPTWTDVEIVDEPKRLTPIETRVLDLRTGVLARVGNRRSGLRSTRFVSIAAPHNLALRAELPCAWLDAEEGTSRHSHDETPAQRETYVRETSSEAARQAISVGISEWSSSKDDRHFFERLASWSAGSDKAAVRSEALANAYGLSDVGFETLLADQRESWARKWEDAVVTIEGDAASELAARFAVFHLLTAAKNVEEAAVGARGLSGDAYSGHVFWDADVFVLPALCALAPECARAMLEYRLRRLPAARAAALRLHRSGARFPWESAASGDDVSPTKVRSATGELIIIRTGSHEEHIVADVAWAAAHYAAWTGDNFLDGAGSDLVTETARYWASRIRVDREGHGHIYGVMGPDEYHEVVDDDAFTNLMARWNLRMGASVLAAAGATGESTRWKELSDSLVDGYRPKARIYEQFAGYFKLEPLLVSQFARPPVAIDVILGARRVSESQLIKQADVLMAHHLIPNDMHRGTLVPCLDFYEPRTAHGSSLSPAISASLFARAGDPERALGYFDIAARVDLDDLTKTTASGVHLATMGGLWQALAFGFLGLRANGSTLRIDPHLPQRWSSLSLRFRFRSQRVEIRAEHERVTVMCDSSLAVNVKGRRLTVKGPGTTLSLDSSRPGRRSP